MLEYGLSIGFLTKTYFIYVIKISITIIKVMSESCCDDLSKIQDIIK